MSDYKIQGEVTLDTSKADSAFARVESSAGKMAQGVEQAAKKTGRAVDGIGSGSDGAAQRVEKATKSMIPAIQRATAAFESGERGSSKYFESIAKQRGANVDVLKPYLDKLDRAKAKQDAATGSLGKFGNAADQVRATVLSLGAAMAGAFSARAFIQTADAVTQLQNQLKLATGSIESAGVAYEALFQIAQRSRVNFQELGSTFASIARASDQLGLSQKQLLTLTETIGNAVTVGGSSAQASSAALMQLSQGLASGVLRGEELNSIMEQTPRLARALADGLNVPIGKLREMGKEGELTSERVINALQSQSRVLAGEVQDSVLTLGQAFTQLGNSATMLVGEVDRVSGSTASMASEIQAASSSLDDIARAFKGATSAGQQTAIFGDAIATVFETVAVLGAELSYVLTQVGDTLGGLAAKAAAIATFNLEANRAIGKEMAANAKQAREEVDALTSRILNSRKLNAIAAGSSGLDTRAEDARLSRYGPQEDGIKKVTVAAGKAQKAVKSLSDEFATERGIAKEWADALGDFSRMAADAEASSLGLSKAQERLVEYLGSNAYSQASESMRELVLQQAYGVIAAEQNAEALKDQQAAYEAITKAESARINALQSSASTVQSQVQSLMEEERAAALAAAMNITLAQAVQEVAIARLQEQQANLMTQGDRDADVLAIQAEIDARRELKSVISKQEQRKAVEDGAKDAKKEWEKTADSIQNTLTEALMRGFESGKGFGKSLGDSIVNTFKTYVANEISKAITNAILSAMTRQNFAGLIGGLFGVGNASAGNGVGLGDLQNAYSAYTGLTGQAGTSTAIGQYAGGTMSGSNLVGSAYGNATGTGIDGLMQANGAYGTAGGANYASVGYTAAGVAGGIYGGRAISSGYSAYGGSGNSAVNTGTAVGAVVGSFIPVIGTAIGALVGGLIGGMVNRAFGRKLTGLGTQINFDGSEVTANDYKFEKGGWFKSDRETNLGDTSAQNADLIEMARNVQESSAGMARAMGYSDEAINEFTGSLKINFKGAETAEEQMSRVNEAMAKLQQEMMESIPGFEMSKEEFAKFVAGIQEIIANAGISLDGITETLALGAIGKMDSSQVGEALSESIIGGIYNTIAQNAMAPVASAFMNSIITPIFTAIMAGVPISQAVSQAAIENVVRSAQQAAAALNAVFSDPAFRDAIGQIQGAISSVSGIVTRPAASVVPYGSSRNNAASSAASERYNLETKLLTLLGETDKLRARELATISASNRSLQTRIWMLEDAKDALTTSMSALESAISAEQEIVQERLSSAQESESLLNGIFENIRDNIKEMRGEIDGGSAMLATEAANYIQSLISSGSTPDADEVNGAISALRNNYESSVFASAADRDRAAFSVINQLTALEGVVGNQLSDAEYQVTLAEDQLQALEDQLELSQSQVNALQGIDDSVLSVADAISALTAAMSGYSTAFGVSMPASVYSPGTAPVQSVDSINFDESSTVYTSGFVRKSGETDELLRQLLTEMKLSRSESIATAVNTNRVALLLKQVTKNGTAMTVETDGTTIEVAA